MSFVHIQAPVIPSLIHPGAATLTPVSFKGGMHMAVRNEQEVQILTRDYAGDRSIEDILAMILSMNGEDGFDE